MTSGADAAARSDAELADAVGLEQRAYQLARQEHSPGTDVERGDAGRTLLGRSNPHYTAAGAQI
jgi:hypothetical protein